MFCTMCPWLKPTAAILFLVAYPACCVGGVLNPSATPKRRQTIKIIICVLGFETFQGGSITKRGLRNIM